MKVKDLLEVALFCDALEIVVRENGCGKWLQGYRIGKKVDMWKIEHTVELQERRLPDGKMYMYPAMIFDLPPMKKDEIRDVVHGYDLPMKIIKKDVRKIPDSIADLEVFSFQPRHIPSFHREQLTHNEFSMDVNCYPSGSVTAAVQKKEVEKKSEQLEGQTDIFDWLGGGA